MPLRVSAVIPCWNGADLLVRHLPAVVAQMRGIAGGGEIVVVDDGSTYDAAGLRRVVERAGPPARLLRLERQSGFAAACNAGAGAAHGRFLVFLNSDVHPEPGCLAGLADGLEADPALFALSPVLENLAGTFTESTTAIAWRHGVLDPLFPGRTGALPPGPAARRPVAFVCGGAFACARDRFLSLGGFSSLYEPFYWEDVDLSWRARRAGWEVAETGSARARHEHAQTIGTHVAPARIRAVYERNRLLFCWVHLAGARAWATHVVWLLPRWVAALVRRQCASALPAAMTRLPAVRAARRALAASRGRAGGLIAEVRRARGGWPPLG